MPVNNAVTSWFRFPPPAPARSLGRPRAVVNADAGQLLGLSTISATLSATLAAQDRRMQLQRQSMAAVPRRQVGVVVSEAPSGPFDTPSRRRCTLRAGWAIAGCPLALCRWAHRRTGVPKGPPSSRQRRAPVRGQRRRRGEDGSTASRCFEARRGRRRAPAGSLARHAATAPRVAPPHARALLQAKAEETRSAQRSSSEQEGVAMTATGHETRGARW